MSHSLQSNISVLLISSEIGAPNLTYYNSANYCSLCCVTTYYSRCFLPCSFAKLVEEVGLFINPFDSQLCSTCSVPGFCALSDSLVKFLDFYISSAVNCCFFVVIPSAVINELFLLCAFPA